MAMKTAVSVDVPHQASDDPIADFLEHDRDTVEAATVAHDDATRDSVWVPNLDRKCVLVATARARFIIEISQGISATPDWAAFGRNASRARRLDGWRRLTA
jgi:hypothetical protein